MLKLSVNNVNNIPAVSVAEPCHFAQVPVPGPNFFVHGSGSGSGSGSVSYPWILSYFFYKNSCRFPWFWFLLSPASCISWPVSRQSRYSLIFFLQQESEPEPELRARIRFRFRFFLGQNDTVPAVPVPVPAPVPQHCLQYSNIC